MEVVSLHIGQAGVAASSSLWQLYCIEHGLNMDGTIANSGEAQSMGFHSFFREGGGGSKASPWALLIDLDPSSIDGALVGKGRLFFSRNNTVTGLEDSGSNYAKARYGWEGKTAVSSVLSKLRTMTEATSSLQGFIVQQSLCGGTGSGLTCNVLEKIYYAFPKKPILQFAIFPSAKFSLSVLEPYNTILGTAATRPEHKCCCLVSNNAMYKALQRNGFTIRPDYKDLNILWDYAIGCATANMRHGGNLNAKLSDILTNLVPTPKLRFPFLSYSPISPTNISRDVREVVRTCFEPRSQMINCQTAKGFYLAATILLRGQTSPQQVSESLSSIRIPGNVNFAPWCPNGFKVSLCPEASGTIPGSMMNPANVSACGLNASTAVAQAWTSEHSKYKTLLAKRAFIHWYLAEGMEESEFHSAGDEIVDMIDHYGNMSS